MAKRHRTARTFATGGKSRRNSAERGSSTSASSAQALKAAEEVTLAAFGSGLRLAAALGTVAAKTTSLALASLATGADKFSELVRKEAMESIHNRKLASGRRIRVARKRRERR